MQGQSKLESWGGRTERPHWTGAEQDRLQTRSRFRIGEVLHVLQSSFPAEGPSSTRLTAREHQLTFFMHHRWP